MASQGQSKVLLVTGASRGIGAATAELAAKRGFAVCVNFLSSEEKARAVVSQIRAGGGNAIAVGADIGDESQVAEMFAEVDQTLGPLTALVNNAGINGGFGSVAEVTRETLERVFATNVFGAFFCAREAIRRMSTANGGAGGSIVNVSSQAAVFGGNQLAHYAASKAALNTLTLGLAREAAAQGIRVNGVSPAVISTDQQKGMDEARREALLASIPAGRMGTPLEVAEAILWLLSDAASYVTGITLPVTGGR